MCHFLLSILKCQPRVIKIVLGMISLEPTQYFPSRLRLFAFFLLTCRGGGGQTKSMVYFLKWRGKEIGYQFVFIGKNQSKPTEMMLRIYKQNKLPQKNIKTGRKVKLIRINRRELGEWENRKGRFWMKLQIVFNNTSMPPKIIRKRNPKKTSFSWYKHTSSKNNQTLPTAYIKWCKVLKSLKIKGFWNRVITCINMCTANTMVVLYIKSKKSYTKLR